VIQAQRAPAVQGRARKLSGSLWPSSPPWTNGVLPSRSQGRSVSRRSTTERFAGEFVTQRRVGIADGGAHLGQHLAAAGALGQPGLEGLRPQWAAAHRQQHQDLVVADQPVDPLDAAGLRTLRPLAQYAHHVRPAVDHVAQIDQPARCRCFPREPGDRDEQAVEMLGAAMHVADGEHGFARQRERCGLPRGDVDGDHCGRQPSAGSRLPSHS
jgi:hypothetical protein